MKTKTVYLEAEGDCVIGWAEHTKGTWHYPQEKINYEYIALGDVEYTPKNGKWESSTRGEESDIITQIKRIFIIGKFEYLSSTDGFLFKFNANAPFLAPDRWKDITGLVKISKENYLPELIWAGLPDSLVFWEVRISSYNQIKEKKPPIKKEIGYIITADSIVNINYLLKVIKRRLSLIGVEHHTKKEKKSIILTMHEIYQIDHIKEMLAVVNIAVYGLTKNKEQATRIGYLRDDPKMQIFLKNKIFDQNSIKDIRVKFECCSKPYILLVLNKKFSIPKEICLEIDGVIISTTTLDLEKNLDKIILPIDMDYYRLNILKSSLNQPLPAVNIKPLSKENN